QGVAGQGFAQLGNGSDVPGVEFGDRYDRFPDRRADVSQPLPGTPADVLQISIILYDARKNLEIGDPPGERIGGRLEYISSRGTAVRVLPLALLAVQRQLDRRTIERRRKRFGNQVEQHIGADVVQTGHADHRENAVLAHFFIESADDV